MASDAGLMTLRSVSPSPHRYPWVLIAQAPGRSEEVLIIGLELEGFSDGHALRTTLQHSSDVKRQMLVIGAPLSRGQTAVATPMRGSQCDHTHQSRGNQQCEATSTVPFHCVFKVF